MYGAGDIAVSTTLYLGEERPQYDEIAATSETPLASWPVPDDYLGTSVGSDVGADLNDTCAHLDDDIGANLCDTGGTDLVDVASVPKVKAVPSSVSLFASRAYASAMLKN